MRERRTPPRRLDAAAEVGAFAALAVTGYGLYRMAAFAAPRHRLPVSPAASPRVRVSAVVPARDEARVIADCVRALCASGPGLAELVVVDDGSTDGTADAAAAVGDPRVRVITAPPLADGALGKPSACAAGAAAATGEWLWFVDADVRVAPDALARLLDHARSTGAALVSALGRLRGGSAAVSWLLPEVGFGLARRLSLDSVAEPTSPIAFASGQCLLMRRDAYDDIGGHGAVVREPVEDVALAGLAKARGHHLRVVLAPDAFDVDMYASLSDAWRGLLKNSAGVRGAAHVSLAREAVWAAAAAVPLAVLAGSRSRSARRLAAAAVIAQVVTSVGGRVVAKVPVWPAVGAPLAELTLVASWLQSRRLAARGETVQWRGRPVVP